jgi:hypothetical protein
MKWKQLGPTTYVAHASRKVGGRYRIRLIKADVKAEEASTMHLLALHGKQIGRDIFEIRHLTCVGPGSWNERCLVTNAFSLAQAKSLAEADHMLRLLGE